MSYEIKYLARKTPAGWRTTRVRFDCNSYLDGGRILGLKGRHLINWTELIQKGWYLCGTRRTALDWCRFQEQKEGIKHEQYE